MDFVALPVSERIILGLLALSYALYGYLGMRLTGDWVVSVDHDHAFPE